MTPNEAFRLVLTQHKTGAALAQLLDISDSHLYDMKSGRRRVPARLVKKVAKLSNGLVKPEDLRPDLY